MTGFDLFESPFDKDGISSLEAKDSRTQNWPAVYTLDANDAGRRKLYIGQTNSTTTRMRQHLPARSHLETVRVLLHDEFNRSAALDLEGWLIARFQGDPAVEVENGVVGERGNSYFDHDRYRAMFPDAFAQLYDKGLFTLDLRSIENTEFFKLSPFKTLTEHQEAAVSEVLDGIFEGFRTEVDQSFAVEGGPGTGKTVVAITLLKQLVDVFRYVPNPEEDLAEEFPGYRTQVFKDLLPLGFKVGFVVPQQALRETVQRVFAKTSGLDASMVLTPYDVANTSENYDVLIVDEAHRLEQQGNHGTQNKRFDDAGRRVLGDTAATATMLDWLVAKSRHQVFLFDVGQSIRPVDLPKEDLDALKQRSVSVVLPSQLRVEAGDEYVRYVRDLLTGQATEVANLRSDYDFKIFESPRKMYEAIRAKDNELGLARMLAGYAWPWPAATRKDPATTHVELDDISLPWNRRMTDWVTSNTALEEVGCIHTIQGYDLNYAGVIIGPDLKMDPGTGRVYFDWNSYHDPRKEKASPKRNVKHSEAELLEDIVNIYSVLMTRGIKGTYVHVVDTVLREYLRSLIPPASE